jgi:hypothetical protein
MWDTISALIEDWHTLRCAEVSQLLSMSAALSFATSPMSCIKASIACDAGKKGAKYTKPRAVSAAKQAMQLNEEQKDILVGTLLGDAYLERAKQQFNARLQFDQTFPAHAEYLTMLYVKFINLAKAGPRVVIRKADKRTGNVYCQMVWKSLTFPCLNVYHDLFYQDGRIIVPANIGSLLSARALAYWFMDDGSKGSNGEAMLHTRSFTLAETQLLQKALMDNFGLRTRLIEKVSGQWVIVIPVKQVRPLKDIVSPFMCVSMLYKLH